MSDRDRPDSQSWRGGDGRWRIGTRRFLHRWTTTTSFSMDDGWINDDQPRMGQWMSILFQWIRVGWDNKATMDSEQSHFNGFH
ncbi:MAG: hypothetical protein GY696_13310 [Gammaproteobacteria bacterium]|nr:hypothetical protein [Gammaproteobacteria bacterium]